MALLKIAHRINTIEQLKATPLEYGVELDLRPYGTKIIIHHDAFTDGEDFEEWLKYYKHSFIILNTKAEGMEERILQLMEAQQIKDYFFLDLSLPFLIKYMKKGVSKMAVRFSEYEPLDFVMKFAGKVDWVWVDCFTDLPLTFENYALLKKHFKLCLVSPELQGFDLSKIEKFKQKLKGMDLDAVCTKRPELW
ncbi:hypothetical protein [Aurantibacillus circumpalustris]|uniref:hypothetical protein n=1 Tax=Aurantibacillus circumpalustris TaxID=3036359 RepID=UPI00295A8CE1|nr:hypothetical protein [Aurantibacillus circumpalustris]